MLSEATMSCYVQAALPHHQRDGSMICYTLLVNLVNLYIIILKLM